MRGTDYGPDIVTDARVCSVDTGRVGTVIDISEGCHWRCRDDESMWRPRSASVLWDDETPMRGSYFPNAPYDDLRGSYVAPELLARIPDGWLDSIGARRVDTMRIFGDEATVRRADRHWHLMNKRENGWMSSSYGYRTIGELLARWGLRFADVEGGRVVSRQDQHGLFWRMRIAYVASEGRGDGAAEDAADIAAATDALREMDEHPESTLRGDALAALFARLEAE